MMYLLRLEVGSCMLLVLVTQFFLQHLLCQHGSLQEQLILLQRQNILLQIWLLRAVKLLVINKQLHPIQIIAKVLKTQIAKVQVAKVQIVKVQVVKIAKVQTVKVQVVKIAKVLLIHLLIYNKILIKFKFNKQQQ
jgi:hypothetical protein